MPLKALMRRQTFAEEILDQITNLKFTVLILVIIAHYAVNVIIWLAKAALT